MFAQSTSVFTEVHTPTNAWANIFFHMEITDMSSLRDCHALEQIPANSLVLHLNDNAKLESSNDKLHKVHPLLNILKNTLGAYINVGTELALDEVTVASKSTYG